MGAFLVLAEVERFDALTRTIGYGAALELLEDLRGQVEARLGPEAAVRTTRRHLEIALSASSADALARQLDALADAVATRVDIDGFGFDLRVAFGAADPQGAPLDEELVVTAELALAEAWKRQRAAILPHARGATPGGDRLQILRALQTAICDDTLELHYQPKLRARGGAVDSIEALIRWPRPDGVGYIPPNSFIPLAEETGDIRALTDWVLARTVTDLAALAVAGVSLRCDVNVSGATLADRDFTRAMVDRAGATGGMIGFEITETAMIADPERALANLRLCAEAGVRLAIDDYGAGFSSLAYLQQLPVAELKIDRSFVSRLTSHQRDPLLVRSTIDLAHALEMEVTAEGVETPQVLALLQVMGCDLVQGFYLSRPLPLDRLLAYLTDASSRTRAPDQSIERLRRRVDAARKKR